MSNASYTTAGNGSEMKWSMPTISSSSVIVDLGTSGSKTYWKFAADQDVVFINSTGKTQNVLNVDGGRNIVILGGDFAPDGSTKSAASIYLTNVGGDVHIEGVRIDNARAGERDGISLYGAPGKTPVVTIQNSVIENVSGSRTGGHGDVFQAHGAIEALRMYNVAGSSSYQGVFLDPQYGTAPSYVDLENVSMTMLKGVEKYPTMFWFYAADSAQKFPVTLTNVTVEAGPGRIVDSSAVWPKENLKIGDLVTWPGLPIAGGIGVGGTPASSSALKSSAGAAFDSAALLSLLAGKAAEAAPAAAPALVQGTAAADLLSGGAGDDRLSGAAGNDRLYGGWGDDRLDGGTGVDFLAGGDGNDVYVIDNAGDRVEEWINGGKGGIDTVESAISFTLGANVENLVLTGSAPLKGVGNALDNVLTGNSGANVLEGGAGNDRLAGGAGNDRLDGGWGNDRLDGGAGADILIGGDGDDVYVIDNAGDRIEEWINGGKGGVDTVESSIDHTLGANVEKLVLSGSAALKGTGNTLDNLIVGNVGANVLDGGSGHDELRGGAGNDRLLGGIGNDRLDGGAGVDVLLGGAGNDLFVFQRGEAKGDTIEDFGFSAGNDDAILLVGYGPDAEISQQGSVWTIETAEGFRESITVKGSATASDFLFA